MEKFFLGFGNIYWEGGGFPGIYFRYIVVVVVV